MAQSRSEQSNNEQEPVVSDKEWSRALRDDMGRLLDCEGKVVQVWAFPGNAGKRATLSIVPNGTAFLDDNRLGALVDDLLAARSRVKPADVLPCRECGCVAVVAGTCRQCDAEHPEVGRMDQ